jgi:drug/metabolite transporter (DMT)-like permease
MHYFLFAIIVLSGLSIFEKFSMGNLVAPTTYLFFFYIFFMINFVVLHWYRFGLMEVKKEMVKYGQLYILGAVFSVLAAVTYLGALVLVPVTLVVPLRRVSTLFTTIVGGRIFKEKNYGMKIIACIIMLAGGYLLLR